MENAKETGSMGSWEMLSWATGQGNGDKFFDLGYLTCQRWRMGKEELFLPLDNS